MEHGRFALYLRNVSIQGKEEQHMNIDIHNANMLAKLELEQRIKALPVVPEYDAPNIEIQPGWVLKLAQRFLGVLGQLFSASIESKSSTVNTSIDKHALPIGELPCGEIVGEPC